MTKRRAILNMLLVLMLMGCSAENPRTIFSGQAFGVSYHVTLHGSHPDRLLIHDEIMALFVEIDEQASPWREDSWVSQFNHSRSLEPQQVPEHVWAMLVVAEQVYQDSGGVFDITAGPLVELWGFGANPRDAAGPPSEMQVAVALTQVGMDKLVIDHDAKTIAKRSPEVTIDLSGLAKGYANDQIAELLDARGVDQYLIEFGGEVLGKDLGMNSEGWVVEMDDGSGTQAAGTLTLRNGAVATSGTVERSRELSDGRRVSHLIDPRTGKPVAPPMRSVTVMARRGVVADAWATALAVDQSPSVVAAADAAGVRLLNSD